MSTDLITDHLDLWTSAVTYNRNVINLAIGVCFCYNSFVSSKTQTENPHAGISEKSLDGSQRPQFPL